MAKYVIEESTLKGLADALRKVTGENRTYTPTEMIDAVSTVLESGTYILVDEEGNEVPAVFVENETTFTAGPNDVRIGTTAVGNNGIFVGEKEIPAYYVGEGFKLIPVGSNYTITIQRCEYTSLQVIICPFNMSTTESVAAEKVSINGKVYAVGSTEEVSSVTVDTASKEISLGITNDGDSPCVMRYFTYKEEY